MNVQEKRKLEELIRAQISKARTAYKSRRDAERTEIAQKLEAKPPAEIANLVSDYRKEQERHNQAVKSLHAKASKHAYELVDNYRGVHLEFSSDHPNITVHRAETEKNLGAIETLTDTFVLDVWSEKGEMQTLVTRLTAELQKLTA